VGFGPGSTVDQNCAQADQGQGHNKPGADYLPQDKGSAQEHTNDWSEKGKGMEETHRVAVDQFEPDEIAEKGNDDTLVKDREARSQRKTGYNGVFQHNTHKEQQGYRKEDLVEKRL